MVATVALVELAGLVVLVFVWLVAAVVELVLVEELVPVGLFTLLLVLVEPVVSLTLPTFAAPETASETAPVTAPATAPLVAPLAAPAAAAPITAPETADVPVVLLAELALPAELMLELVLLVDCEIFEVDIERDLPLFFITIL